MNLEPSICYVRLLTSELLQITARSQAVVLFFNMHESVSVIDKKCIIIISIRLQHINNTGVIERRKLTVVTLPDHKNSRLLDLGFAVVGQI